MKWFNKIGKTAVIAVSLSGMLAACSGTGEEATVDGPEASAVTAGTGMALTMDILGDTDVAGMRYDITRTPCPGGDEDYEDWETSVDVDLEDLLLPGGLEAFEDQPLDENSEHLFADYFTVVPAGCYDVDITPLNAEGNPSEDCAPASAQGVEVEDGETTEILLVSQCDGPERGALDTVAVVNHEPTLDALTYNPSKFTTCGDTVEICATASDPDSDPIEFDWTFPEGITATPGAISSDGGTSTQCATVTAAAGATYEMNLTVYDMFVEDGEMIRAEDWLQARGEDVESHDDLNFPLHVQCEEGPICPEGAAAIESYSFSIISEDGIENTNALEGNLPEEGAIIANFTIAPGCEDIPVALGSYADADDEDPDLDPSNERFDVDAGIFDAGNYTMRVSSLPCAYSAIFGIVNDFDEDSLPGVDRINALSRGRAGDGLCD